MYSKDVDNYKQTIELIQDANTIDGGECETLDIVFHAAPTGKVLTYDDIFIVLKSEHWSIDYNDIDKFAEYLKSKIKSMVKP